MEVLLRMGEVPVLLQVLVGQVVVQMIMRWIVIILVFHKLVVKLQIMYGVPLVMVGRGVVIWASFVIPKTVVVGTMKILVNQKQNHKAKFRYV